MTAVSYVDFCKRFKIRTGKRRSFQKQRNGIDTNVSQPTHYMRSSDGTEKSSTTSVTSVKSQGQDIRYVNTEECIDEPNAR